MVRYFLDNLFEKPECEKNCLLICLGLGHLGDTVGIKDQETPCVNENTFSPSECPLGVTTCGISLIFSRMIRFKNLRSHLKQVGLFPSNGWAGLGTARVRVRRG